MLFVVFVWLCVRIWRVAHCEVAPERAREEPEDGRLSFARWGLVAASFLLMLMVIGNTQASLAPLGLTLFST